MRVSPYYTEIDGWTLLGVARVQGLEGIVSKRKDSKYRPNTRSRTWVKTIVHDHPMDRKEPTR